MNYDFINGVNKFERMWDRISIQENLTEREAMPVYNYGVNLVTLYKDTPDEVRQALRTIETLFRLPRKGL